MTAAHTRISRSIWSDPDFVKLTPEAKLLYLHLITNPKISMVGALDHTPARWAYMTSLSRDAVTDALEELEGARFVLADHDAEEIVIRTFVRHDVNTNNPKMAGAVWSAWSKMYSTTLQAAILHEFPTVEDDPKDSTWDLAPAEAITLRDHPEIAAVSEQDHRSDHQSDHQYQCDPLLPPSTYHHPPTSPSNSVPRVQAEPERGEEVSVSAVIEALADFKQRRAEQRGDPINDFTAWRVSVKSTDMRLHTPKILELLAEFDAPAATLAGHLMGEPTNLVMYRRQVPA